MIFVYGIDGVNAMDVDMSAMRQITDSFDIFLFFLKFNICTSVSSVQYLFVKRNLLKTNKKINSTDGRVVGLVTRSDW